MICIRQGIILKKNIKSKDFIICLAASGNTPFTNEIIKLAVKNNVKCLAISNNPAGLITKKQILKLS